MILLEDRSSNTGNGEGIKLNMQNYVFPLRSYRFLILTEYLFITEYITSQSSFNKEVSLEQIYKGG